LGIHDIIGLLQTSTYQKLLGKIHIPFWAQNFCHRTELSLNVYLSLITYKNITCWNWIMSGFLLLPYQKGTKCLWSRTCNKITLITVHVYPGAEPR
jgi:hypothetical protein